MRKRSGPNIEHLRKKGLHDDVYPFKTTLSNLPERYLKEDCKVLLIYPWTYSYKAGLHAKPCQKLFTYLRIPI